jgi:hypothetical protein
VRVKLLGRVNWTGLSTRRFVQQKTQRFSCSRCRSLFQPPAVCPSPTARAFEEYLTPSHPHLIIVVPQNMAREVLPHSEPTTTRNRLDLSPRTAECRVSTLSQSGDPGADLQETKRGSAKSTRRRSRVYCSFLSTGISFWPSGTSRYYTSGRRLRRVFSSLTIEHPETKSRYTPGVESTENASVRLHFSDCGSPEFGRRCNTCVPVPPPSSSCLTSNLPQTVSAL